MNKKIIKIKTDARTLKLLNQSGRTPNIIKDTSRLAMAPGKRISKNGKIYWETRTNRSDRIGSNL